MNYSPTQFRPALVFECAVEKKEKEKKTAKVVAKKHWDFNISVVLTS